VNEESGVDMCSKESPDLTKKPGSLLTVIGGVVLIAIGILGLALPILPGWILIFVGLALLGEDTRISRAVIAKMPPKVKERFMSFGKVKK
jgi:hypothetical protein